MATPSESRRLRPRRHPARDSHGVHGGVGHRLKPHDVLMCRLRSDGRPNRRRRKCASTAYCNYGLAVHPRVTRLPAARITGYTWSRDCTKMMVGRPLYSDARDGLNSRGTINNTQTASCVSTGRRPRTGWVPRRRNSGPAKGSGWAARAANQRSGMNSYLRVNKRWTYPACHFDPALRGSIPSLFSVAAIAS